MQTNIPPDLAHFIQGQVACGKYATADAAVSEAVRLLQAQENHLAVLRREIEIGGEALERGEAISVRTDAERQALIEDIQQRGRERFKLSQDA